MAILNFVKPDKIVLQKSNDFEAQFEFRPLEPGYGVTIGNALRRVLLNSLEGYAIVGINIAGADHEFATIKGVTEDVTEIILNLKQVRFKKKVDHDAGTEKISLSLKNKSEFTAGMIGEASPSYQVMNPDLLICTMDTSAKLEIEITIGKGRGYVPAEAVKQASRILIQHLMIITDENITFDSKEEKKEDLVDEQTLQLRKVLKTPLEDLDLSVRAFYCLKAAKINSLSELVTYEQEDLMKFRNFGQKSLAEIEQVLHERGLHFGMDLSKLKLDDE